MNALVPELKARGVEAIVVLIHQGGYPTGRLQRMPGHLRRHRRHRQENRSRGRRGDQRPHPSGLCLQHRRAARHPADKYGTVVTAIDLKLDRTTRDVISAKADNVIVRADLASDPAQTALLAAYDKFAAPIANRAAGSVTQTLTHAPNDAGESPLGDIIADAQLAATSADANGGAVIALTNPGGIRTDITKKQAGERELCRRLRQPAVPQPAGHDDAVGRADQGRAGAAMARPEAAADPAGLQRVQLPLGRRQTLWRARDRRQHDAERRAHRACKATA